MLINYVKYMEKIDYGDLYGVRPGETDFSGVIERLKDKEGYQVIHLDKEYLEEVKQLMDERRKSKDP